MTIAKRDLKPGEILDRFGGYTTYGVIERAEKARKLNALPVGISPGATVIRPVPAGGVPKPQDMDEGKPRLWFGRRERNRDAYLMREATKDPEDLEASPSMGRSLVSGRKPC